MENLSSPNSPLPQDSPNRKKAVAPTPPSPPPPSPQSPHIDSICLQCKHLETKVSRLETDLHIYHNLDQYQTSEIKRLRTVTQSYDKAIWHRVLIYLRRIQDAVYNANRVFEQVGLNVSQGDFQELVRYESESWNSKRQKEYEVLLDQDSEEEEWKSGHVIPGAWPTKRRS